jgi:hypothetical protein
MSERTIVTLAIVGAIVATSLISAVNNNINNRIRAKLLMAAYQADDLDNLDDGVTIK